MKCVIINRHEADHELMFPFLSRIFTPNEIETSGEYTLEYARKIKKECDLLIWHYYQDIDLEYLDKLFLEYKDIPHIFVAVARGEVIPIRIQSYVCAYFMKPFDWVFEIEQEKRSYIEQKLVVKCFGNFEVYVDQEPVRFRLHRTKELLAYLIDRHGRMISNNEICSVLWNSENHQSYFKELRRDLESTMEQYGFGNLVLRKKGLMGLNLTEIDCDYYRWEKQEKGSKKLFQGEYMSQYGWAEYKLGMIMHHLTKSF